MKPIYLSVVLIVMTTHTMAGGAGAQAMLKALGSHYESLDKSQMTTQLFLDQGFVSRDKIAQWTGTRHSFMQPKTWDYVANSIVRGWQSGQPIELPLSQQIQATMNDPIGNETAVVNMASAFITGDLITPTTVWDQQPQFQLAHLFAVCAFHKPINQGQIQFVWPKSWQYLADQFDGQVAVNLGDGNGYQTIDFLNDQQLTTTYTQPGEKLITTRLQINGLTYYGQTSIEVLNITPLPPTTWLSNGEYKTSFGHQINGIQALHIEGGEPGIQRPIILSTGFDFLGNHDATYQAGKYGHLIHQWTNAGLDVIVLAYIAPEDPVSKNATRLRAMIKWINAQKTDHQEGIILGASMGGITARMALKQMELDGEDHEIGLYISYDAPHEGANLPIGIQAILEDVYNLIPEPLIMGTDLVDVLEQTLDTNIPYVDVLNTLRSRGTMDLVRTIYRDFISYQRDDSLGRVAFAGQLNTLHQLGFPENCRNVAVVNGSLEGQLQEFPDGTGRLRSGDQILNYEYHSFVADIFIRLWANDPGEYSKASRLAIYSSALDMVNDGGIIAQRKWQFEDRPIDQAPGGYEPQGAQPSDLTGRLRFCFIPTNSSTAIPFDQYDISWNKEQILAATPFDTVYGLDHNNYHIELEKLGMADLVQEVVEREFQLQGWNLRNRKILGQREFVDDQRIEMGGAGTEILPEADVLFSAPVINARHRTHVQYGAHVHLVPSAGGATYKQSEVQLIPLAFEQQFDQATTITSEAFTSNWTVSDERGDESIREQDLHTETLPEGYHQIGWQGEADQLSRTIIWHQGKASPADSFSGEVSASNDTAGPGLIRSIDGKIIRQFDGTNNHNIAQTTGLPSGLYLVTENDGKTHKLIVH